MSGRIARVATMSGRIARVAELPDRETSLPAKREAQMPHFDGAAYARVTPGRYQAAATRVIGPRTLEARDRRRHLIDASGVS